jgi:putative FmdB family regulatory protein
MPLYEFCCISCNLNKELNLPVDKRDANDVFCEECGYHMIRVLTSPAIQFKGGGFYSTGG